MYHFLMMEVNFELIDESSQNLEIFGCWCSACNAIVEYEGMVLLIWRISLQWLLISSWFPSNDQIFLINCHNRHALLQGPQWHRLPAFHCQSSYISLSFLLSHQKWQGYSNFLHFSPFLHNKSWYLSSNLIISYIYLPLNSSFHNISTFSSPSKTSSSHPPFLLYFIHLCFSLFASPSIPPLLSMLYIIFHVSLLSIKNHFFNSISL